MTETWHATFLTYGTCYIREKGLTLHNGLSACQTGVNKHNASILISYC